MTPEPVAPEGAARINGPEYTSSGWGRESARTEAALILPETRDEKVLIAELWLREFAPYRLAEAARPSLSEQEAEERLKAIRDNCVAALQRGEAYAENLAFILGAARPSGTLEALILSYVYAKNNAESSKAWKDLKAAAAALAASRSAAPAAERCYIIEHDGAFKCFTHNRMWGAVTKPDEPCTAPAAGAPLAEALKRTIAEMRSELATLAHTGDRPGHASRIGKLLTRLVNETERALAVPVGEPRPQHAATNPSWPHAHPVNVTGCVASNTTASESFSEPSLQDRLEPLHTWLEAQGATTFAALVEEAAWALDSLETDLFMARQPAGEPRPDAEP